MSLASARLYQKFKRSLAAFGLVVRTSATSVLTSDPSITAGSGAPSDAEPNGSAYLRTAGGLYQRCAGAWVPVALPDVHVLATVAVGNATGSNAATCTLQLKQLDNSTNIASARQVLLLANSTQYQPYTNVPAVSSVTFGTATVGSIVASGQGWALVETSATGAFACTCTNSDDETTYFYAQNVTVSDLAKATNVVGSNSDTAVWAA